MLHFGIRDQNLELKIGISDEKIYLVTTLVYSNARIYAILSFNKAEIDSPFG